MRMVVLHAGCYGHTYSGTDGVATNGNSTISQM